MKALAVLLARINLRHVRERRLRTLMTVAGVTAGVALVTSIAIINTTVASATRDTIRNLAGAAEIEVAAADPSGFPEATLQQVRSVAGVQQAVPALRVTTSLTNDAENARVLVLGATFELASLFPEDLGELGRVEIRGGFGGSGRGLLIAQQVASELGIEIGDRLQVETPRGRASVEASGVLSGQGVNFLNGGDLAVMALPAAQRLFEKQGRLDSIYVVVDPDVSVESVDHELEQRLSGGAIVGPPGERGRGFEETFESISMVTSMSGLVSLFVAMFVVFNTMSMSIAERRREIAMALALGATKLQVFAAFLAEAALIGIVASALGLGLGVLMANLLVDQAVAQYTIIPIAATGDVRITADHVALGVFSGIFVSLAGALVPARRTARVAPAEALRPHAPYGPADVVGRLRPALAVGAGIVLLVPGLLGMLVFAATSSFSLVMLSLVASLLGATLLLPPSVALGLRLLRPLFSTGFGTLGRLASEGLGKNLPRTSLTVAALVFTLGLVIGVGGALRSFESQFVRFANGWYGPPLYVQAASYRGLTSDQPLAGEFEQTLARVDGVDYVLPFKYGQVSIGGAQVTVYLPAVTARARQLELAALHAVDASPDELVEGLARGEVVVSRYMAERRELEAGDRLMIPTPAGEKAFRVAGVFYDLASFDTMYMGLPTYRKHWRDRRVDHFGIVPEQGVSVAELKDRLQQVVEAAGIPARVITKQQQIGQLLASVRRLFDIARGIQLAALIVAALTIANTMFTTVLERRWEFGLQRAVGMGRRQLGGTVLLEAIGIGALGATGAAILGTLLGVLMLSAMRGLYAMPVPFEIPWPLYAIAAVFAIGIAAAAAAYPRRVAVRAPIIECLRYE